MICGQWQQWIAESPPFWDLEPSARETRSKHLRQCWECRRYALEDDPTLMFIELPKVEVSDAEVDEILATVGTLRRARALEKGASPQRGHLGRNLAAAALLTALLLVPGHTGPTRHGSVSRDDIDSGESGLQSPSAGALFLVTGTEALSLIENLNRPEARIYQLTEDDLSVVMIVDESLDL